MHKANAITGAAGLVLVMSAAASAQTSPGRPAGNTESKPARRTPSNDGPVFVSTEDAIQNNGGSLFQASMADLPAEERGKASSYSSTAVPEPEPHVYKKHDLVNIVVSEDQKSSSTGATQTKRSADFDVKADALVKFNAARFSLIGGAEGANPPELKLEATRDFQGEGDVSRTDSVTLRLEAEVVDVKPNGTMVLQATKRLKNDEEEVTVKLTGTCRVQDIDAANQVLSTDLKDLDFNKQTKGAATDGGKRGWASRLLDFLNPF